MGIDSRLKRPRLIAHLRGKMAQYCCTCLTCNGTKDNPKGKDKVSTADLAGKFEDVDCKMCKVNVQPCGPLLCLCFFLGPCPFSCTPECPAGTNCWTNFQGHYMTVVDKDTFIQGYFCCGGLNKRVGGGGGDGITIGKPSQMEMK